MKIRAAEFMLIFFFFSPRILPTQPFQSWLLPSPLASPLPGLWGAGRDGGCGRELGGGGCSAGAEDLGVEERF